MTCYRKEVKSVDGFVLDGTPQSIKEIDQSQSPQRMTFWNERQGAISTSCPLWTARRPLEGVTFKDHYDYRLGLSR